jgi:hypothetical protein
MRDARSSLLVVILALLLAACGQPVRRAPSATPVPPATVQPSAGPSYALTAVPPTVAPASRTPGAAMPAPPTAQPTLRRPPPSATTGPGQATDDGWQDRAIYRSGLTREAQPVLEDLAEASIYHLEVQLADDLASLQGTESVRYTHRALFHEPLAALYFQLFANISGGAITVTSATVDGQPVEPEVESERSTLRVPLSTPLRPGGSVIVWLDYRVELPREAKGGYGLLGIIDGILVLDGFYPAIPVYDERGWHVGPVPPNADETFQQASFYLLRLTTPDDLLVAATWVSVDRQRLGTHQVLTIAAGPARDFYVAASTQYAVISETVGETTVNSYALPGHDEAARVALHTAAEALASYGARLGAYPYTEFDVVSTPLQGAYGIEYPGIVGISRSLYQPQASTSGGAEPAVLESTVAHEAGHQWFYNVVGNDQISEPWLDEATVQYLTGLYFLDSYGQEGYAGYRQSWLSRWERVDRRPMPIGLSAASYTPTEYGAILYGRGPLFVEALAQRLGQPTFDRFLRDDYQSQRWGIATTGTFRALAEAHCHCDLAPLFAEWVYASGTP